ncbi:hypothetical protein VPH35_065981 [Triticum aestivum]
MARHSDDEARDREEAKGPGGGGRLRGGRGGRQRCRRGGVPAADSMGGAAMRGRRAGGSRGLGCGVQRRQRRDSGAWHEEATRIRARTSTSEAWCWSQGKKRPTRGLLYVGWRERRKEIGKRRLAALGDRRKRRGIEQVLLARCVR